MCHQIKSNSVQPKQQCRMPSLGSNDAPVHRNLGTRKRNTIDQTEYPELEHQNVQRIGLSIGRQQTKAKSEPKWYPNDPLIWFLGI